MSVNVQQIQSYDLVDLSYKRLVVWLNRMTNVVTLHHDHNLVLGFVLNYKMHLDSLNTMQIVDRRKDVIKSGGEWISSIDLENIAVGHQAVKEACVIGVPHPKWDERPILLVVLKDGASATKEDIITYVSQHIAKFWTPDDVIFVPDLPHTATGKLHKVPLREKFANHLMV